MVFFKVKEDAFTIVEKALKYKFWDKERERSNHATQIAGRGPLVRCPTRHNNIAWSGPPHDLVEAITCLDCGTSVSKLEMADRGYDFNLCPDWIYIEMMDEKIVLKHTKGDPTMFGLYTGKTK